MNYTIRTSYRMWAECNGNPFALLPGSPTVEYDPKLPPNTWALDKNGKPGTPVAISKNPCEDIRKALLAAGAKVEQHKKQNAASPPPPPQEPEPEPEEEPAPTVTTPAQVATAGTPPAILAEPRGVQMVWQL